jgi:hypothetical protein
MTKTSCPTALVNAPVGIVWNLLTDPGKWGEFFDVRIIRVLPEGAATVGQIVHAESGPRILNLKLEFRYIEIDVLQGRLLLDVNLPFGMSVRENLLCSSIDAGRCRVNYGCHFDFPRGWRGVVARLVLRREVVAGPADSLARLKHMAETIYLRADT